MGKITAGNLMGKSISFDTFLIEDFLQNSHQAEAYLKEAVFEGDLKLLQMSVENLIKAGYESFTIDSKDSLTRCNIQLN
jgi:DNA-binding phage protein